MYTFQLAIQHFTQLVSSASNRTMTAPVPLKQRSHSLTYMCKVTCKGPQRVITTQQSWSIIPLDTHDNLRTSKTFCFLPFRVLSHGFIFTSCVYFYLDEENYFLRFSEKETLETNVSLFFHKIKSYFRKTCF